MLARLLHPDGQIDLKLKELAERQMKRLGELVETLVDPAKRSQYDDILLAANRPLITRRNLVIPASAPTGWWDNGNGLAGFVVRHWFWILMGIFVFALGTWNFMQSDSTVMDHKSQEVAQQRDSTVEHRDTQPVQKADKPKRGITPGIATKSQITLANVVPIAKRTGIFEVTPPALHSGLALEAIPPSGLAAPELLAKVAGSPLQSIPPFRRESALAGTWLYSPQSDEVAERGSYAAMYVELLVVEHDGKLSGDYHARYKVLDQAVSPEVTFQVRGSAGSDTSTTFTWFSRDKAKGLAEMTLRSPNVLYISWWTTEFGRPPTLGSGTALLIRQQAP